MSHLLSDLETLLRQRAALRKELHYFDGASQRDPNYNDDDERAFRAAVDAMHDKDAALVALVRSLRETDLPGLTAWVEARNAHREERLAQATQAWERAHLSGLVAMWRRVLVADDPELVKFVDW